MVILDCDGVLIDSEVIACEAVALVLERFGYTLEPIEVARRFAGFQDREIARQLMQAGGPRLPEDFPQRCAAEAMARFPNDLKAVAGARDFLKGLRQPFCVASNSGRERLRVGLEVAGLLPFFPDHLRFSAQDAPRPKPAPDLHLLAAARLGAAPGDTLVIEDSPSGVAAAKAAGMRVIGFCGASHLGPGHEELLLSRGAERCVQGFSELAAFFR